MSENALEKKMTFHFQEKASAIKERGFKTEEEKGFDMGNYEFARTPDEAMEKFINREFPDVLEIKTGSSHDLKFIPDTFIYKNLTEKVKYVLNSNGVYKLLLRRVYFSLKRFGI